MASARRASRRPVHVGCSGWNYEDWRGVLYPEGLAKRHWLERYAEEFATVEVNSTFYRLASEKAVERWIEQTPAGFLFTVKASRYLTHVKRLADTGRGVKRFYAPLEPMAAAGRLGPTLWQLPANFPCDLKRLETMLAALPPGRHAFEFRHASWFCDDVYAVLRQRGAALVIGDHPDRPFQTYERTAPWTLVRFHFGARGRDGNYSAAEIDTWARRLRQWRRDTEVFAYFNNDWRGYAVRNARRLRGALVAK